MSTTAGGFLFRHGPGQRDSLFVLALALWLALIQVSIAASQIVLTGVLLAWGLQISAGRSQLVRLPLDGPIALFAVLSLLAATFSFDPAASLASSKKLLLLFVPYVIVSVLSRVETLEKLILLLIAVADLASLVGLWQYYFGEMGDINNRIRGFMGHYMTYSGLLMGVATLALARLLFRRGPPLFLWASLLLIYTTLVLTLTRNAWLGVILAASLLCLMRDRRLLLLPPLLIGAALVLLPPDAQSRVRSFFQPDYSGIDRIYMLRSGADMVRAHPWLGVGPAMVAEVYPIYVIDGAPHQQNPHLHNNLAQIAAERGLPCLLAWLWLMGACLWSSAKAFRTASSDAEKALAAGAIGVLTATMSAGMFEYNFGDSEFLMFFLFTVAVPFVWLKATADQRVREAGSP